MLMRPHHIISYQKIKRNMISSLVAPVVWLGYTENRKHLYMVSHRSY